MDREEMRKVHLDCMHNMHLAYMEYEIDFWSQEALRNIKSHRPVLSDTEYDNYICTIIAVTSVAKNTLRRQLNAG